MNRVKEILKKHELRARGYEYNDKAIIVETDRGKYVIKKDTNNFDIYNYLNTRGFNNFPKNYNDRNDDYDIYDYIDDIKVPDNQKIEDLVIILSNLHYKTSYYQEMDLDEIKKVYEDNNNKLLYLAKYYNELNDYLDSLTFLSPGQYLLVRNIYLIYYMINFGLSMNDKWYNLVKDYQTIRVSLIHNNISKEHLLVNDDKYLISWDKSKIDRPIFDLLNVFKKYYRDFKLSDLLNLYKYNNELDKEEKNLLIVYLSIPEMIEFTSNNLDDTIKINNQILYLKKVYEYIKKYQEKV